ncbi:MAG: leucine-rich repeat domain-containing protein [Dehalococcoidia bacterium]
MKIILGSRRHHGVARVGTFLIAMALIAGMVGCGGGGVEHDLTISSTAGGSVTSPGEGTSTYDEGEVVSLVATPASGYQFVNWTGDVGTIANVNDATTTITMDGNYSITANFAAITSVEYSLTISSTVGGEVTTPSEGISTYDGGTVVDLVAEAEEGYRFVNWTGDVGAVANVTAASTTITMSDDYSLAANFEELVEYDLTTSSTAGGSVTVPGEGTFTYYDGTVINLVATAASGYYFVNWTGDVGTITNVNAPTTTVIMNDNYSVTANFEQIPPGKVALTTSSTAGGSVTIPGEGAFTYNVGKVVSLVASPASGYRFVNWTGNVGTIANVNAASTTITMNGDYSITANFMAIYDLTISSTAGGSVTTPGEGTFTYDGGTIVNLVANPISGYRFVNWTGDVSTIANVNTASTTITMNGDYSITANFIAQYDLTISSTAGGSVTTPGAGTFTYDGGTVVNLVATPASGYRFVNWTGDVGTVANVNAPTTTITMNGDYSITANFIAQYDLTISSTAGGSVTTPGEGISTYDEGTVVDLVATPDAGYRFVNWTGDVGTIANVSAASTTITMNGDYSITANFMAVYDLTISSTAGGSVTTPGEGTSTYDEGTVVNLVATPDACYYFVNWTGDVGTVANINAASTTITMNGDYSITANFAEEEAVTFPDPNLEAAIRGAIGKPTGPICPSDLEGLTYLSASGSNIADLTGLEHCTSLTVLLLGSNQISDISPLANLTNLIHLTLDRNQISSISALANLTNLTDLNIQSNQISSISALANLTNLTHLNIQSNQISSISPLVNLTNLANLHLSNNQISDISSLANLTNLTQLSIIGNQISDISPLANLTNLTQLQLPGNQISDISPLANLTNLTSLSLGSNQISDIYPLVQNTGLGTGDHVWLDDNPLSSDSINIYIPELEARGVTVFY